MATSLMTLATMLKVLALPQTDLNPIYLQPPPEFTGPLAPNNVLQQAFKYADNQVTGPESMVTVNGYVYTGLANGRIVEVSPGKNNASTTKTIWRVATQSCKRGLTTDEKNCGRPLGFRRLGTRYLFFVDAYKGIFLIDFKEETWKWVVHPKSIANRTMAYFNDLVVSNAGMLYFTSSSAINDRTNTMKILLQGDNSSLIGEVNLRTGEVKEFGESFYFTNGIELTQDQKSLLIAEATKARIWKVSLEGSRPMTLFANNLPGFPDNIRRTPRNTYWVGISSMRSKQSPGLIDVFGPLPQARQYLLDVYLNNMMSMTPKYGLAIELDASGRILRSVHDQSGTVFPSVSEVQEHGGYLYVGNFAGNFIGKIPLEALPPVFDASTPTTTTPPPPVSTPPPTGNPLVDFLNSVTFNLYRLSVEQLRTAITTMVQRLLELKAEALRAVQRANSLQQQLNEATNASNTTPASMTVTNTFDTVTSTPVPTTTQGLAAP